MIEVADRWLSVAKTEGVVLLLASTLPLPWHIVGAICDRPHVAPFSSRQEMQRGGRTQFAPTGIRAASWKMRGEGASVAENGRNEIIIWAAHVTA